MSQLLVSFACTSLTYQSNKIQAHERCADILRESFIPSPLHFCRADSRQRISQGLTRNSTTHRGVPKGYSRFPNTGVVGYVCLKLQLQPMWTLSAGEISSWRLVCLRESCMDITLPHVWIGSETHHRNLRETPHSTKALIPNPPITITSTDTVGVGVQCTYVIFRLFAAPIGGRQKNGIGLCRRVTGKLFIHILISLVLALASILVEFSSASHILYRFGLTRERASTNAYHGRPSCCWKFVLLRFFHCTLLILCM